MKFKYFPIIFFATTLTLFSQSKLDSLVAFGNEESFQFNFEQAEKTFQSIIQSFPESSEGYYFIARNALWFYLANKDSVSKHKFLKYYKLAERRAKKVYEQTPKNSTANYNLGNIYFLKSIYSTAEQKSMDAFWATKSAVNHFEDAIDYNQNYYKSYLPLGIIKYALGFVPGFLGWAISVAGLEGEQSEGIHYLKIAYEKCHDCKTEAGYHLGKIYTEYNAMYDCAENFLSQIVQKYPNNELFIYQYAILKIDAKELDKAEELLNRVVSNKTPKFLQTYTLSFFLKGEVYFKQNKFEEAIAEYEKFITKTLSTDYTGIANLKIALAYEMLGEKHQAQKHYILARNGNENIPEDEYAARASKKLFDKIFSTNDKLLINARNFIEAGEYSFALQAVDNININQLDEEAKFNADIIRIEAYQSMGNFLQSSKVIKKNIDKNRNNEFEEYDKFLYLMAYQNFVENRLDETKENLEAAFDVISSSKNKLKRLLLNLSIKIAEKRKKHG